MPPEAPAIAQVHREPHDVAGHSWGLVKATKTTEANALPAGEFTARSLKGAVLLNQLEPKAD